MKKLLCALCLVFIDVAATTVIQAGVLLPGNLKSSAENCYNKKKKCYRILNYNVKLEFQTDTTGKRIVKAVYSTPDGSRMTTSDVKKIFDASGISWKRQLGYKWKTMFRYRYGRRRYYLKLTAKFRKNILIIEKIKSGLVGSGTGDAKEDANTFGLGI